MKKIIFIALFALVPVFVPGVNIASAAVFEPGGVEGHGAAIIAEATGNFFGDGGDVKVELLGNPMENGASDIYMGYGIRVTANNPPVRFYGKEMPTVGSSYYDFKLCDIDGDGIPEIFFCYDIGASAGIENAVIISLQGGKYKELFNIEKAGWKEEGDNPPLPVLETKLYPGFFIRFAARSKGYSKQDAFLASLLLDLNRDPEHKEIFYDGFIYARDGSLIEGVHYEPYFDPGFRYSGVADIDGDGRDEVYGAIPVKGVSNADNIAYINIAYKWMDGGWKVCFISITDINNPLDDMLSMKVVVPSALKMGDKVGIIAPANRAVPERLEMAVLFLTEKGFEVVVADNIDFETEYSIGDGSERMRADAFNKFARDPDIKAIFCLRGGYGSMHLLRYIDYEELRRNKPIFVGFSDITAMHTAIFQTSGLVTFHGPMLSSNYGQQESFDLLFDMLMRPKSGFPLKNINGSPFSVINEGTAEGVIVGGNMTLISSLMGTEYELDLKDKILFIEDLDEAPYRLHRYLWQLKLAGKLDEVAAVVIGDILPDKEYDDPEISIKAVFEALKDVNVPILYNVRAGHDENPLTIPIGAKVRIDGNKITVMQRVVEEELWPRVR